MADDGEPVLGPSLVGRVIDRRRDVGGGGIPTATTRPDSPVFDIPNAEAVLGQVITKPVHEIESVLVAPEAAVDEDDKRRAFDGGGDVLAELVRKRSVRDVVSHGRQSGARSLAHMDTFGPLVDSEWLEANLDQVSVFDSRKYLDGRSGRDEFERGHIAGAVFVDLDADLAAPAAAPGTPGGRHPFPNSADFAAAMGRLGYDGTTPAVIYDDVGGGMAGRMRFMLNLIGIPSAVLDGGIQAWHGPTESGPVDVEAATFEERPWPADRLVDADEVARRIEAGATVMDARNASRFAGKENRIDDRFGHVPGAINLAWEDNIDDFTGTMLSFDQLRARYAAVVENAEGDGPKPVAYCGSGVTACHNLMALELLGIEADLYVGSWSEWGSDESRPLETGG